MDVQRAVLVQMEVKVESQYLELLMVAILARTVLMVYRDKMELLLARILESEVLEEQPLVVRAAKAVVAELHFSVARLTAATVVTLAMAVLAATVALLMITVAVLAEREEMEVMLMAVMVVRAAAAELPWVLVLPQMEAKVALGQTAVLAVLVAQLMHLLEVLAVLVATAARLTVVPVVLVAPHLKLQIMELL